MNIKPIKSVTVVESLVTYISLGWAYVMLTHNDIFEKSQNFDQLKSLLHAEWVVGLICLFLAGVKLAGIFLKSKRIRWAGLMLSTVFWIFVSTAFLVSGGIFELNTGFIVYSSIAVMSLLTSKEVMAE